MESRDSTTHIFLSILILQTPPKNGLLSRAYSTRLLLWFTALNSSAFLLQTVSKVLQTRTIDRFIRVTAGGCKVESHTAPTRRHRSSACNHTVTWFYQLKPQQVRNVDQVHVGCEGRELLLLPLSLISLTFLSLSSMPGKQEALTDSCTSQTESSDMERRHQPQQASCLVLCVNFEFSCCRGTTFL